MSRVLVIDDEPSICWSFDQALSDSGHEVCIASTAEAAFAEIDRFQPEVVLLDFRLPGMDGLTALRRLQSTEAKPPVILMTAFGSLDLAVSALGDGAFDYLPKPFDLDDAVNVVARALASRGPAPAPPVPPAQDRHELVGVSRGMQEVFRQIALVAQQNVPVLITGESGVGKELVARAIHKHSGRDPSRFVPVCVPVLSESVMESELFGHVKGAFTGADRDRPGLLEQAHEGTAFFDEIGDVPLAQQVKLLRVLEDQQVTPVGGNASRPSSFRLVAATHQPLDRLVAAGRFREDLYYRLSVFQIHIPALRDRPDDIPALASRFLSQIAGDRSLTFSDDTLAALRQRHWRGNVRELRSAVQHAAVVCRGRQITTECLPAPSAGISTSEATETARIHDLLRDWARRRLVQARDGQLQIPLFDQFLDAYEPPILEAALDASQGNRRTAAELLGLHRETLRKRLRKYGIGGEETPDRDAE
ncbi:MAG: sigma-54-dependent Fis family transcriptional regulator [Planctomyces sp.]|nr:sigma-54-dependent Fis family transcriptional regulator [Planctomyces sp.]